MLCSNLNHCILLYLQERELNYIFCYVQLIVFLLLIDPGNLSRPSPAVGRPTRNDDVGPTTTKSVPRIWHPSLPTARPGVGWLELGWPGVGWLGWDGWSWDGWGRDGWTWVGWEWGGQGEELEEVVGNRE